MILSKKGRTIITSTTIPATLSSMVLNRPLLPSFGITLRNNGWIQYQERTATTSLTTTLHFCQWPPPSQRKHRRQQEQQYRSFSSTITTATSTSTTKTTAGVAQPWVVDSKYQLYRNGQFVTSDGPAPFEVRDPSTQDLVGAVPEITKKEFDDTVASARDAFEEWKRVPVQQRQRIMLKFQQAIRDRTDDLAYLVSLENGKTLDDARGDVFRGLEVVESACFLAPTLLGDSLQGISKDMDCVSFREPLGVCAGMCVFMLCMWSFMMSSSTLLLSPPDVRRLESSSTD